MILKQFEKINQFNAGLIRYPSNLCIILELKQTKMNRYYSIENITLFKKNNIYDYFNISKYKYMYDMK